MRRLVLLCSLLLSTGCATFATRQDVVHWARHIPADNGRYNENPGANLASALAKLEATVAAEGITIEMMTREKAGEGAYGFANKADRHIWLVDDLSVNTRFEVLAHEAAHIFQPIILSKMGAEVFAELVAFEVAKHYGHNMKRSSAFYLAQYKEALVHAKALDVDIARAVKRLTATPVQLWQ